MKGKIIIFAISLLSMSVSAYELGWDFLPTDNPDFDNTGFDFERNHERMTALALICLHEVNKDNEMLTNKPEKCSQYNPGDDIKALYKPGAISTQDSLYNYFDLIRHVRWSDDPTRMLIETESIAKFMALMGADKVHADKIGLTPCSQRAKEGEYSIVEQGWLCNSHYGKFQFLHAMAEKDGEPSTLTHKKMMQWLDWSFYMIKTELPHHHDRTGRNENYCDFWDSVSEYPDLAKVMNTKAIRDAGWCEERRVWFKKFPEWMITTPLNFTCDGVISSAKCDVFKDNKDHTIKAALGSIIHMIQDSYANGHTDRGSQGSVPIVKCEEIKGYRGYFSQDKDKHTESDKWPAFDSSCLANTAMDPITATAQAIWLADKVSGKPDYKHITRNNAYNRQFAELKIRVFGKLPSTDVLASAGDSYLKKDALSKGN